jgi:hypothetical protein
MRKLLVAVAVAAIASVPGVTGLAGNASFAQSIPVQVPVGARTIDDHGRHAEPGDDHGRHAEAGDDRSGARDPGMANTTLGSDDAKASGSVTAGDGRSRRGAHDDGTADQ